MTALTAWGIVAAYLVIALLVARKMFDRIRPSAEPVRCKGYCSSEHYDSCYGSCTDAEALAAASGLGLVWPFIWPALLTARFIMSGEKQRPEELQAEIKRLEKENQNLKDQGYGA